MIARRPHGFFKVMGFWVVINAFWIGVFAWLGLPTQQIGDVVTATGLGVAILAVVVASLILTHDWTFLNRFLTAGMGATGVLLVIRGATLLWGQPRPWILWPVRVIATALMFTALSALIAEVWESGEMRRDDLGKRLQQSGWDAPLPDEPLGDLKSSVRLMRQSLNPFMPALVHEPRQETES